MPPFASLSIKTSDQLVLDYNTLNNLPVLDTDIVRDVFEEGVLPNGQHYSIQLLKPEDYKAVYALYETEYASGSKNLVRRTEEETKNTLDFNPDEHRGGLAVAVVLDGHHLASVGFIDMIDDEKDQGRGSAVDDLKLEDQIYFKGITTHPDLRGTNFPKMIYPYRVALAVSFDRGTLVTKALDTNETINKAYKKNGWSLYREREWLEDEQEYLNTYTQTRKQAVKWLKDNHTDIFQRLTTANENTPYAAIRALAAA